jgi:hypothetical protein
MRDHATPYVDPIVVEIGDVVTVDPERTATTDVVGWLWCIGPDGRAGWTPEAWIDTGSEPWRMRQSFDAHELTVAEGERARLHHAESGFVWCTHGDRAGWLPDGILRLDTSWSGARP